MDTILITNPTKKKKKKMKKGLQTKIPYKPTLIKDAAVKSSLRRMSVDFMSE